MLQNWTYCVLDTNCLSKEIQDEEFGQEVEELKEAILRGSIRVYAFYPDEKVTELLGHLDSKLVKAMSIRKLREKYLKSCHEVKLNENLVLHKIKLDDDRKRHRDKFNEVVKYLICGKLENVPLMIDHLLNVWQPYYLNIHTFQLYYL